MMESLSHLTRLRLPDVVGSDLPSEDCWVDTPTKDIPNTVMAYIAGAPPNVKALTFVPTGNKNFDDQIRAACELKHIVVVWARPPLFVRYLDKMETGE